MPRIILKETITKEIDIPIDTLCKVINNLTEEERAKLFKKIKTKRFKLTPFKKDKIESILSDFRETDLYEEHFLKDLEKGLRKSSVYRL